jgi:hypothetical protein
MTQLTERQKKAFSVTLEEAGLFDPTDRKHGVKYVGELPRSVYFGNEHSRYGQAHLNYFRKNGLPALTDPVAAGWRPPYFDDPAFHEALNKPIGEVIIGQDARQDMVEYCYQLTFGRMHNAGIHYAGQLFSPTQYDQWFYQFADTISPIRKIMCVPADWQPPKGIPEEWRPEYDKLIQKCIQIWEQHPQKIIPKGEAFGEDVPFEIQSMFAVMGIFDTQTIATMPEQELAARLRKQPGTYPGQNFSQMYRPYQLVEEFVRTHRPNVNPDVFPKLDGVAHTVKGLGGSQ